MTRNIHEWAGAQAIIHDYSWPFMFLSLTAPAFKSDLGQIYVPFPHCASLIHVHFWPFMFKFFTAPASFLSLRRMPVLFPLSQSLDDLQSATPQVIEAVPRVIQIAHRVA